MKSRLKINNFKHLKGRLFFLKQVIKASPPPLFGFFLGRHLSSHLCPR